jgi:hypothetical protein
VDEAEVSGWFHEYLDVFAACGRGDVDLVEIKPAVQRVQDECFHLATL